MGLTRTADPFDAELLAALPKLRHYAARLTKNHADTDDLVQAAVEKAIEAKASYTLGTHFVAWIARIARNQFINERRSRRAKYQHLTADDLPEESRETFLSHPKLVTQPSAEDRLVIRDINRALRVMPVARKAALKAVRVQGVEHVTYARQVGIPVGTSKSLLYRAEHELARVAGRE